MRATLLEPEQTSTAIALMEYEIKPRMRNTLFYIKVTLLELGKPGEYRFEPPQNIPGGTMVIANATWDACTSCGEEILPDELTKAIEAEQYRRPGLLPP